MGWYDYTYSIKRSFKKSCYDNLAALFYYLELILFLYLGHHKI